MKQGAYRSLWRFSLRELLLLMLVAAAILGWGRAIYQKYSRFSATPFSDYFVRQMLGDLREVCKVIAGADVTLQDTRTQGSSGENGIHRRISAELPLAPEQEDAFWDEVIDRIHQRIEENGGTVGNSSILGDPTVTHMPIQYHYGITTGVVVLQLFRKSEQTVHFSAFLDEQKSR
ncbi:MAG TPA: hypothetical protein VGI40_18140 [Pirellulaceae bacterium]|jgi:hypothetical protein